MNEASIFKTYSCVNPETLYLTGDKVECFVDSEQRQYYWHRVSANNRIIASSGEGFRTKWGCKRAALRSNPDILK